MSELTQPDAQSVISDHFQHVTMARLRHGASVVSISRLYHDPQTLWIKIASRIAACMVQVAATAKVSKPYMQIPTDLLEHQDPVTATMNAQVAFAVSDFFYHQCDSDVKSTTWTDAFNAINQECEDWGYERMKLPGFTEQDGVPIKHRGTPYDARKSRFMENI